MAGSLAMGVMEVRGVIRVMPVIVRLLDWRLTSGFRWTQTRTITQITQITQITPITFHHRDHLALERRIIV